MEKEIHSSDFHNTPASTLARARIARDAMNMLEGEDQLSFLVRIIGPELTSDTMRKKVEKGILSCALPIAFGKECSFSFPVDISPYLDMNMESFLARIVPAMKKLYPVIEDLDIISSLHTSPVFSKRVIVTFTMNKKFEE